jgi:peptidoglycan/LPS O-acetylase OafA/YrhL
MHAYGNAVSPLAAFYQLVLGCLGSRKTLQPTGDAVFQRGKHIAELDGLRGLAILLVTIYRFGRDIPTDHWLGKFLHATFLFGDRGVDLFFVLSGFLITGILMDGFGQPHFLRNFFARRTLRIFPLYFLALTLFLIVIPSWSGSQQPFPNASANQFFLWTYLTNIYISWHDLWCFDSLDHFWSLAVEEHFYLVWPLLICLLGNRKIAVAAFIGAIVCAGSRIIFAGLSSNGVAPDAMSFFRFDGLLLGGCIAALARTPSGIGRLRAFASLSFLPLLGACLLIGLLASRFLTIPHSLWAVFWSTTLVTLLTAPKHTAAAKLFRCGFLKFLGRYSYSMYIFQSPLIPLVAPLLTAAGLASWFHGVLGLSTPLANVTGQLVYITIMFGLLVLIALTTWHLLEKHCLRLKHWFDVRPVNLAHDKSACPQH